MLNKTRYAYRSRIWCKVFPNTKAQNHCSLIRDKIIFKTHDHLYVFIHVEMDRRGGRQGEEGRAHWPIGGGPWTGPWITGSLSVGFYSEILSCLSCRRLCVLMQSWRPSCYFPQISLTREAGSEKMHRLRPMSLVPQHSSELPGASLKRRVTSLTGKWSKD